MDALSREFDVPAEKLTKWRDAFLNAGLEGLKDKPRSPINTENQMLKQMIGEKSMEIELLTVLMSKLNALAELRLNLKILSLVHIRLRYK